MVTNSTEKHNMLHYDGHVLKLSAGFNMTLIKMEMYFVSSNEHVSVTFP